MHRLCPQNLLCIADLSINGNHFIIKVLTHLPFICFSLLQGCKKDLLNVSDLYLEFNFGVPG